MFELKQISATHIVAASAALDKTTWSTEAIVLRIASDEVLVIPPVEALSLDDPYAIVVPEGGFAAAWVAAAAASPQIPY